MNRVYGSPEIMILKAGELLNSNRAVKLEPKKWQGLDLKIAMIEVFDLVMRTMIPETLDELIKECNPDLPWSDDHFEERIGGEPTNPGKTYFYWPYYREDTYREGEKFTHTYQERFWPKHANSGSLPNKLNRRGVRYVYGDYDDLVFHLYNDPDTRQAFLPVWFPEDTGVLHGGRVPCTLGYLFNYRHGYLHMSYYIRSCDYIRHFKNDVYLACRLAMDVLSRLRDLQTQRDSDHVGIDWNKVKLGRLKMDIESLHIFETDKYELKKRIK